MTHQAKPRRKMKTLPDTLPAEQRSFLATEQQLLFIKEWAAGNSVFSASQRAGYVDGGAYAYQMVKNPHVLAIYQKEKAKFEAAGDMSRQKVMGMLQEAYDMAKLMSEPASMVAAAREVGKMCGYYAPVERKIKIEGNVILDKMNRLSDAELLELVNTQNQQVGAAVERVIQEIEHEEDGNDDATAISPSPLAGPASGLGNEALGFADQDPRDEPQD